MNTKLLNRRAEILGELDRESQPGPLRDRLALIASYLTDKITGPDHREESIHNATTIAMELFDLETELAEVEREIARNFILERNGAKQDILIDNDIVGVMKRAAQTEIASRHAQVQDAISETY